MRLYFAELRRVCKSLTFWAACLILVLFVVSQGVLPSGTSLEAPQPNGQFQRIPSGEPERIMPEALGQLEREWRANSYVCYPLGFFRLQHLDEAGAEEMGEGIEKMQGADWPEFQRLMAEADQRIGGGTQYAALEENFGFREMTYSEALAEYELVREEDRFTGAYAREFSDYVVVMLAILAVFPAIALYMKDSKSIRPALYAAAYPSWKLTLCRFWALVSAILLPIFLMGAILTFQYAARYGQNQIDWLAYPKYTLGWLMPTAMLSAAVGMLSTVLTGLPVGAGVMLVWWFAEISTSDLTGSYHAILAPRHNALGDTGVYLDGFSTLVRSRLLTVAIAILLIGATIWIYEKKRRGWDVRNRLG